ncbi:MAG TPA: L,D-transpeptidase [Coleofasciculaceae cyanobacterium]|jgi:lipoprotein-anchoring transpeptidase ErfK/SrfK
MVVSQSCSQSLIKLCFSSAILLLGIPQQVTASPVPEYAAANSEAKLGIESFLVAPPELPPIGDPNKYLPGQEVPTRLVLKLRVRRVYVYRGNEVKTSYPVAIGKAGWETPVGTYQVRKMIRNPTWEHPWTGEIVPPGLENPLGTRWIGFWTDGRDEIGFHGTPNEQLIGQAVSHGCVRMRDRDVQALFEQVSVGTPVTVQP